MGAIRTAENSVVWPSLLEANPAFPSTRFQGSKLKIVDWIWTAMRKLEFGSALDAFGGTGSVGYMLKCKGKLVTYNDIMKFNWIIGKALIENDSAKLSGEDIHFILTRQSGVEYPTFIRDTFKDIYFTDEENEWIDVVATNIRMLDDEFKRSIAFFALFQSCIIKRPFNLFHRKNLYLRFSDVERKFGNKVTWDTSFENHFRKFIQQANNAVFSNGQHNTSLNHDIFDVEGDFDLVYIDTPYISSRGVGTDYLGFYHFLEGLANYSEWGKMIDHRTRHRRLKGTGSLWIDKNRIHEAFDRLFEKFRNSILVVSYRSDGIPSVDELVRMLRRHKNSVEEIQRKNHKYVLSVNQSEEVLLIGK
ncbi:MAG: DNA adenine methylase [Nitrospirae bacterium]|nr:DNA adenine methylase [Nitrospirota bacterium]